LRGAGDNIFEDELDDSVVIEDSYPEILVDPEL